MFKFLLNSGQLFLNILIIGGLLLLLFIWNPMGIFGAKLSLQPTANITLEIREMGELITAEFYGEVITSLDEARVGHFNRELIGNQASMCFRELWECIEELRSFEGMSKEEKEAYVQEGMSRSTKRNLVSRGVRNNTIMDKLEALGDWDEFQVLPLYREVLGYLYEKYQRRGNGIKIPLNERETRQLLISLFEMGEFPELVEDTDDFITAYISLETSTLSRGEARKKLAMVGRGTVKAGFDLTEIDESMYHFNEKAGELHFFGLAPRILNVDINPWFIPERGVPGFDILMASNGINFKDAKKVKEYALRELEASAHRAEILANAEKFGEETFRHLFSLIKETPVKKVYFHHDKIISFAKQIQEDGWIDNREAVRLNQLIREELKIIDSLRMQRQNQTSNRDLADQKWKTLTFLLQRLQQLPYEDHDVNFNCFSTKVSQFLEDEIIDDNELESLAQIGDALRQGGALRDSLLSLWSPGDTLNLQSQYSESLGQIIAGRFMLGMARDTLMVSSDTAAISRFIRDKHVIRNEMEGKDNKLVWLDTLGTTADTLHTYLFPYRGSSRVTEELSRDYGLVSRIDPDKPLEMQGTSGFWVFNPKEEESLFWINSDFTQLLTPYFAKKCVKEFPIGLSSFKVFFSPEQFEEAKGIGSWEVLSESQCEELEAFIGTILDEHKAYSELGPVSRAHHWIMQNINHREGLKERWRKISNSR
jgi:hypothetical protein